MPQEVIIMSGRWNTLIKHTIAEEALPAEQNCTRLKGWIEWLGEHKSWNHKRSPGRRWRQKQEKYGLAERREREVFPERWRVKMWLRRNTQGMRRAAERPGWIGTVTSCPSSLLSIASLLHSAHKSSLHTATVLYHYLQAQSRSHSAPNQWLPLPHKPSSDSQLTHSKFSMHLTVCDYFLISCSIWRI